MPAYEFRCSNCGHEETVVRPMTEASDVVFCPEQCAPFQPMERVFTPIPPHVRHGTPGFHRPR